MADVWLVIVLLWVKMLVSYDIFSHASTPLSLGSTIAVQYKVTGRSGATVRAGEPLDSPIQCTLTPGTIVEVSEVRGRHVELSGYFYIFVIFQ